MEKAFLPRKLLPRLRMDSDAVVSDSMVQVISIIECIKVISADTIHIYFKDGTKIAAYLNRP